MKQSAIWGGGFHFKTRGDVQEKKLRSLRLASNFFRKTNAPRRIQKQNGGTKVNVPQDTNMWKTRTDNKINHDCLKFLCC